MQDLKQDSQYHKMTIITGLNNYDAVLLDGAFFVQLSAGTYEIDGEVTTIPYSGRQFTVSRLDHIYHLVKDPAVPTGFVDEDGNPFGSIEQWRSLKRVNSEYLESGYPSLEKEFSLRTELAKYDGKKMVLVDPEPHRVLVDFNIIGALVSTGSKFIQSALSFGKASFGAGGVYQVDRRAISIDEFDKLAVKYPKLNRDGKTDLQFAKYAGDFLFTREADTRAYLKGPSSLVCTTLDEARGEEEAIRKHVRQVILVKAEPKPIGDLSETTITDVLSKLQDAQTNLSSTQAMKSSRGNLSGGRARINEAIQLLRNAIDQ
jgi:hypothetical protein